MDSANPIGNESTIALVLLHQYTDSDAYRELDASRRAILREAIENLTAFEAAGPTWPSRPAGAPSRAEEPTEVEGPPTAADDEPNGAAAAADLLTDFRVS